MKKTLIVSAVVLFVVVQIAVVLAGVPADKETIKLDFIAGKKGVVTFPHKKHAEEFKVDGKAIACNTCHHTAAKTEKEPKGCSACHVKEGEAQKEHKGEKAPFFATKKDDGKIDMKTIIFHKRCTKCHKDVAKKDAALKEKGIAKCTNCHPKK